MEVVVDRVDLEPVIDYDIQELNCRCEDIYKEVFNANPEVLVWVVAVCILEGVCSALVCRDISISSSYCN